MLNIFGKLYTFLRRPQPTDAPMAASGEWEHVDTPNDGNTSGTNIDVTDVKGEADSQQQPATPDVEKLAQQMKTLGTWEVGEVGEGKIGPNGDHAIQEVSTAETSEGEKQAEKKDTAQPHTDKTNENKKNKKDGHQDRKVCKYFRTGQKCYKGRKCPFEHTRKGESNHGSQDNKSASREPAIKEADFPRYSDFVAAMTERKHLVGPKDLIYKLGYQKDMNGDLMGQTVVSQYQLATTQNNWFWVKDARYFSELFFSMDWINENLVPQGKVGKQRKPKQKTTKADKRNTTVQGPVRDIRIKDNPNIQVYTGNAAGDGELKAQEPNTTPVEGENLDGFVTDYTEQVLQHAMKQALGDGLSESLIMEVIDDVVSTDTPRKRGKVNKVDLGRTPQKRPDQLAFGFNFHADKLVADSPVSETGEVLVPGVPPTTPGRKVRDQLALGFNYHSDILAKTPLKSDSSDDQDFEIIDENMKKNEADCEKETKLNGHFEMIDNQMHQEINTDTSLRSGKTQVKDIYAVGFSYNSDQLLKQSLDQVNGNLTDEDLVSGCIEEVNRNENESGIKITEDELPLDNRPAGSVW